MITDSTIIASILFCCCLLAASSGHGCDAYSRASYSVTCSPDDSHWHMRSHCRRQRETKEAVAYVLHTARSWVQLRASPADRPQSEQIWCSQVMGGQPHDLRQFGEGGTPSQTSHATRRAALAGTLSSIRAT